MLDHVVSFPPVEAVTPVVRPALVLGSTYRWRVAVEKNGQPWNLSGAVVNIVLGQPNGDDETNECRIVDVAGGVAWYDNAVADLDQTGVLSVCWTVTKNGVTQRSVPVSYNVVVSP